MATFPSSGKVAGVSTGLTSDLDSVYGLLQSILGPVVLPSGITSGGPDSAAINAALATNGICHLLPGAPYYANTSLLLPTGATLEGHGATINTASGITGSLLALSTTSTQNVTVRNVTLQDSFTAALGGAKFLNAGQSDPQHYLDQVTATGFGGTGIQVDATSSSAASKLVGCKSVSNLGNGFILGVDVQATLCEAGGNAGHGFTLAGNCMLTASKAWFSGHNAQTGLWSGASSCGLYCSTPFNTITGCSFQQNALHGIELDGTVGTGASQCTVTGNEVDTNSTATANTGSGIFVNQATFCVITGNTGGNNTGLGLGSQLWGIQITGTCTGTVAYPNVVGGSSGPFNGSTSWTAPSLGTGFGVGSVAPGFRTEGAIVRLRGVVSLTTNQSAAALIFTLPAGSVPNVAQSFTTPHNLSGYVSGTTFGTVTVDNTGKVSLVPSGTSGNAVSLSGIVIELD